MGKSWKVVGFPERRMSGYCTVFKLLKFLYFKEPNFGKEPVTIVYEICILNFSHYDFFLGLLDGSKKAQLLQEFPDVCYYSSAQWVREKNSKGYFFCAVFARVFFVPCVISLHVFVRTFFHRPKRKLSKIDILVPL